MPIKISCHRCGKTFSRHPKRFKEIKHFHFCSEKCRKEFGYRKPAVFINCKNCGKEIKIFPSREGTTVFCNRNCQREYEASKHTEKICPECNKKFKTIPSRQFFIYCSRKCYEKVLKQEGEDHPRWKGGCAYYYGPNWQSQSEKARKRDNYTCQVCGKHQDENYRDLDVHHKKRFQEFGLENYKQANRLSNLITLCPTCHHKVEAGKI